MSPLRRVSPSKTEAMALDAKGAILSLGGDSLSQVEEFK